MNRPSANGATTRRLTRVELPSSFFGHLYDHLLDDWIFFVALFWVALVLLPTCDSSSRFRDHVADLQQDLAALQAERSSSRAEALELEAEKLELQAKIARMEEQIESEVSQRSSRGRLRRYSGAGLAAVIACTVLLLAIRDSVKRKPLVRLMYRDVPAEPPQGTRGP